MLTAAPPQIGASRILVVEDEAIIAEELQDRLARLKFDVVGVENSGQRAIEAVKRTHPDLVLMDIRLKGKMDGIETAAEIRKEANVPIVYLTAHSDPATLQRAKDTAPLGYILKPIHERELEVAIEMAMHRHALESQLRESESRYAVTLESIGDAVLATDIAGRVTFLNRVAESLTGWRSDEARGRLASEVMVLVDEESREKVPSPVEQVLQARVTIRLATPTLLLSRDGTAVPIDDSAAPIVGSRGELLGAVVAFHDIRERRRTESALQKVEAQLRQSQKLEAVGQLAGGVAHDFNNFLTAINGYCELLVQGGSLDENAGKIVHRIFDISDRSAQLTRQLLAFSRQQKLSPRIIDLNKLIERCDLLLRRLINEQIEMHFSYSQEIPKVRADPVQIEQIIMNLVVNARDAMPQGGKLSIATSREAITEQLIGTRATLDPGDYVVISVTDTGIGMDQATQDRIFEPFYTTKELGKGTGLGLATVYGIVKQSGGFIYVYSELGRGSVFKVYLPAISGVPDIVAPEKNTARPTGDESVLLVEDNDAVRQATAEALLSFGFKVVTAASGKEALDLIRKNPDSFQMLVSDVVMPGMSGPALAEELLKIAIGIPILFISGYTDNSIDDIMRRVPGSQLLQKPFMPVQLAKRIREVLDATKPRPGR